MARLSTCKQCGKTLQIAEKCIFSNKSYCKECYDKLRHDADAYKHLIEYTCKIFDITQPTGLILKQLKNYKLELDYNYAAMTYTLWYINEVLNMELDVKYGVAMIKYHYDDAKKYYEQQAKIAQSVVNAEIKTKIIEGHKPPESKKFSSLIDITKMIGGEDH